MDDLISRQAAIKAIAEFLYYPNNWDGMRAGFDLADWEWKIKGVLSDVPSAQPTDRNGQERTGTDLISRQAAIDILMKEWKAYKDYPYVSHVRHGLEIAIAILDNKVPSAQPTQKNESNTLDALDCVSRQAAIDVLGVFTQADALGHTPKQIVEALPSAQRTGRWIEDSGNIACSECHIIWLYRRTAFCPNCGAKMEVEE